ncbi:MAG: hypothetical protein KKH98_11060, partial [Spirochaetes bacterium]|nr:hypothetical protein [Spirochaetota bacterium]
MLTILFILACIIGTGTGEVHAIGVIAGTRITNRAQAEHSAGLVSTMMSTQVMAIYGMTPVTGATDNYTYPGGTIWFEYSLTNNSNIGIDLYITLSNFIMTNNYSGSDWRAWLSLNTAQTIIGTNAQSVSFTNLLNIGASTTFTLYIQTANNSQSYDWGMVPMVAMVTTTGVPAGIARISAGYSGDNGIFYGGTNFSILYPKVTINAPFLSLRKTLSISNTPVYLANGGLTNIPVPDSVITYTNYYDNDGNARATNLIIIDRIPYHTDYILNSDNLTLHTGGAVTLEYRNRGGAPYVPTGLPGTTDANIGEVIFRFSGNS